jgi:signal transduction histidine kinase
MTAQNPCLFIVDDTPINLEYLTAMLNKHGYEVYTATSGQEALQQVLTIQPDLILLDVAMPEMDGYAVCRALKANPASSAIPVVFLSAGDHLQQKLIAFQVGGVDYVTKPFQTQEVLARIQTHVELHHRRLEVEQLRQSEVAYLNNLNKMKDEVLKMVSHDLKNPLGRIMGGAELLALELEDALAPDHPHRASLSQKNEIILQGVYKMRQMLDNLLQMARNDTTSKVVLHSTVLQPYLNGLLTEFDLSAQAKQLDLFLEAIQPDLTAKIAPEMFAHAVQNLLSNAIRYTPQGGQVSLGARQVSPQEVAIYVHDTGIGIAPSDIPRLFEQFYRAKHSAAIESSGVGLGLSIVKTIVEQHQGRIEVESALGVGSTFTIYLPYHP